MSSLNAATAALLCALVYAAALIACDGRLIFSFDDAYIHLSMAEQIARGQYGVNPGEAAAASSSILYPLVLTPGAALGVGDIEAALLNITAAIFAAWLAGKIAEEGGLAPTPDNRAGAALLCIAFALAANLPGLALSGMEHAAHVAVTLAALLGLLHFLKTGQIPLWWIVCCAILAPGLRYEGLSIAVAIAILLAVRGRWGFGLLVAALAAGIVAADMAFRASLGLPVLPSSVLVKLGDVAAPGQPDLFSRALAALDAPLQNLQSGEGAGLSALLLLLLMGVARDARAPRLDVAFFCAFVILAHLAAGRVDWMARYTPYAIATGLAGCAYLFGEDLARFTKARFASLGLAACVIALCATPALATLQSPLGASSIYRQQYQVHRFATRFWRAPIAINDLGWVSYRNEAYVLDLLGLGSEEARRARAEAMPGWRTALARKRGVETALLYEEWLETGPDPGWTRVARLQIVGPHASAALPSVAIFSLTPPATPRLCAALAAFEHTLPRGARLLRDPGAC